jgi:hypothetical protein
MWLVLVILALIPQTAKMAQTPPASGTAMTLSHAQHHRAARLEEFLRDATAREERRHSTWRR